MLLMCVCIFHREAFANEQRVVDVKEAMKWILGPYLTQTANLHFKLDVCDAFFQHINLCCS